MIVSKSLVYACGLAALIGPPLTVFAYVLSKARMRHRATRAPVKEKLLRAPGESLRRDMEAFDDRLADGAFKVLGVGFAAGILWLAIAALPLPSHAAGPAIFGYIVLLAVTTAAVARRANNALTRHANNVLGFRGERAVGEELNRMMLGGCLVFHDVPGEGAWNIDHVVVAPTGVFAIETKTRRKGKCPSDRKDYEVNFTGDALEFPHCQDTHGIEQARANAKWLGQFLSKALAENVYVRPILTLPGWLVNRRVSASDSGIFVGNPKEIAKAISGARSEQLTGKQMQQIAHQLEQRCRDVEF